MNRAALPSMIDPLRTDRAPSPGDVPERDRDARIEELLLAGLDHYFAGQHELAVNVWSRVLFLDRSHARARAYIERARSAVAERLREGDELLHGGVAAFNRGDASAARRLLASAVERGAPSDEAFALLERLDRLELVKRGGDGPAGADTDRTFPADSPVEDRGTRAAKLAWIGIGACAGVGLATIGIWLWTGAGAIGTGTAGSAPPVAASPAVEPLPVPTRAQAALTRAERLWKSGRLHDALALLATVREGDSLRGQADLMRASIQRQLLEAARAAAQPSQEGQPRR